MNGIEVKKINFRIKGMFLKVLRKLSSEQKGVEIRRWKEEEI